MMVTKTDILVTHRELIVDRCLDESIVLALLDATVLDYDKPKKRGGSGGGKGVVQLMAHFGLAMGMSGRSMGIFSAVADFRAAPTKKRRKQEPQHSESERAHRRWLECFGRARQLAAACPDTPVITVCERTSDNWPLLWKAAYRGDVLLVRDIWEQQPTILAADGRSEALWDHVAASEPLARKTVSIRGGGDRHGRESREAELDLRACTVTLASPQEAGDPTTTQVLAVSATEPGSPQGETPLQWLLLTTEGEATAEQAAQVVGWYERRLEMGDWLDVLKTGARNKKVLYDFGKDLRTRAVLDAATACHIHYLNRTAHEAPDTRAEELVDQDEIDYLYGYLLLFGVETPRPESGHDPDIRTFVIDLAKAAGFESRESQPLPGIDELWKAYIRFKPMLMLHRQVMQEET